MGLHGVAAGMVFMPVGMIQGSCRPFAGMLADRYNSQGLLYRGHHHHGFQFVSERLAVIIFRALPDYDSPVSQGFFYGTAFHLAQRHCGLRHSRHKMAQASGLFNVIRQIGGSFGVALFSTMLIRRRFFICYLWPVGGPVFPGIPERRARPSGFAQTVSGGTNLASRSQS